MRAGWHLLVALALWCAASAGALAEKRVALVIGNSGYQHAVRLANPANDADSMAKMFKDIGFDVVEVRRDVLALELRRAIREFSVHAHDADVAIVFYAGHAFEMNGANYLVPADAKLERDFDVEDETVPLDRFLTAIESAKRLRLVILDACRDNPFVKKMRRTAATRAVGQGLAKIDVTSTDTLIAFAAKAGSVATDGEGPHSPFTAALLKHLPTPGLDVRIMFGRVRDDVFASTARRQEPFVYGSLGGSDVMLVPAPGGVPVATGDVRSDYEAAERVGVIEAWDAFLARHGTGFFANLAREQRAKLLQTGGKPDDAEAARKRQEEERKSAAARKAETEAQRKRADEERQRVERERAEREKAQREEAARIERERLAREKDERERAEREKAQREELARQERDKARREEVARAEREQAERERARREEAARAEEERRLARERAEREKDNPRLAMLPPAREAPAARPRPPMSRGDLILAIKRQLRRVGCYPGKIDESWGDAALTRAITQFVKQARFSGATGEPSYDFLDALSATGSGICTLECGRREVARNGRCVPKACPPGQAIGGEGECIAVAPGARR
jgi:Caspase domain